MKNTILNKVSSLAKKSLTLCPPPFAGKAVRGLCTILLLCASVMGWAATRYCGETVQSTGENTSISVNVTIQKLNETTTRIILDNEHITGLRDGGCFQQWPGGVWKNDDNAPGVADFEIGWTQSGNKWQKDFEWDTYPTTANIYFLMSLDNETSEPHGALFTLTDVDMSATCSAGGGEDPTPPARTGYCGDDIFNNTMSADDPYRVKVTSAVFGENYVLCFESAHPTAQLDRLDGANFWCYTSGENCHMSDNYKIIDGKVYFIVPSTSAPKIYTDFCFFFNDNQQRVFSSVNNVTFTACSEAVDFGVDIIDPSITAASLASKTSAQAVISITATDDVGVTECAVYDGTAHLGDYVVSDGEITVTELMYNHAYTLTIKAKDATGNISANSVNVSVTTDDNTAIIDDSDASDNGNMALSSAGSSATAISGDAGVAIDDNTGSRWESAHSDPQTWTLDLGQERVFNNIQISWEGAYGKTFTLAISDDNTNWTTIYYVNGQALAGFPYLQDIDLPQLKARYIRFHGIERGTIYGYSFYEFRVQYKVSAVLTTIAAEIDKRYCKIGTGANLSLAFKDQYGSPIDHDAVSYNISPDASYGSVSDGVFTPVKSGLITITAQVGSVISDAVTIWGTSSDNLAKNKLHSASTGETVLDNKPAADAVDDNEGTEWQSHAGTTENVDAEYEYNSWLIIDLEDKYDVELVSVKFEGASSQIYTIDFVDDLAHEWKEGASYSGSRGTDPRRDEYSSTLQNNSGVRYVRLNSTKAATHYGMKVQELRVFGTVAASPTKSVSAAVNDPAMGTATVTQNSVAVTEVATGSTVTFSAVANDGYLFTGWSNGETRATFDATVDAAMNLTANFRALNHISCNEEMTQEAGGKDYTIYVTYKKTGNENEYKLIVRSAQEMLGFNNAFIGGINGTDQTNLNGNAILASGGHTLSYTFTSTTEPKLNTPLYVHFTDINEVVFNQVNNSTAFEFSQPCEDPEITAIALNKTSATLDMGNTLTLVPTFTPAYMSADITWESSDNTKATVSNGVVTPVAIGEVTITAKVSETIKATCAVTVQAAVSHNWYGYGTSQDLDYTYRIEYTTDHHIVAHVKRQGYIEGLVAASMEINKNNVWTTINVTEGEEEGWEKGTTTLTYTAGDNVHILIQSASSGPLSKIEFDYEVGSDNVMPTIEPSTLMLSNSSLLFGVGDADIQLTADIHHRDAANKALTWVSDDETVATVADGLVHPVGVGTTTVRATTHNSISAECSITVVSALEPTVYWGSGYSNGVGIAYTITRNANHTLTYSLEAIHDKSNFWVQVNDGGDYHTAPLNEGFYVWTSENTYADNVVINGFFYAPYTGGAAHIDFHYVVGSESERQNIPIVIDQEAQNSALLEVADGAIVNVTLTRSFTEGNLYTLVLPFDVDAAQMADQLPGTMTKLDGVRKKANDDMYLSFVNVSSMEAGVAYLYTPSRNVTNPVFENVVVDKVIHPSTYTQDGYTATYTGVYNATNDVKTALSEVPNAYILGNDQWLYEVAPMPDDPKLAMKAFRGYFTLSFGANAAPGRRARVVFGDIDDNPMATDLEELDNKQLPDKRIENGQLLIIRNGHTYNAQGQLLR